MSDRSELARAIILSITIAILTLLPYLFAQQMAGPGDVFSGFLLNPVDGFSYLAKMRQGEQGDWLFKLPYASEPGEGSFLFIFYLFLGHIARILGISAIFLFHFIRFVASGVFFITIFFFLKALLLDRLQRWMAYGFILVGSGIGWLAIPFNILASDLSIPESIPFLTSYVNPHFPIAACLFLLLIMMAINSQEVSRMRFGAAVICSTFLALIQPFSIFTLGVILFGWLAWEALIQFRSLGGIESKHLPRGGFFTGLALGIGAIPILLYDFALTKNHPAIAAWNAQNLTPSPSPLHYLLGFGIVVFLAAIAIAKHPRTKLDRLLISWVVLQALLLYAPFGLQRRLSLGLFFPLAVLAAKGLGDVFSAKHIRLAFTLALILSIPSNLIVIASGLAAVRAEDRALVLSADEQMAYRWLRDHAAPEDLVLTGPVSGNRIPAYANLRVLYGHPFETPEAESQLTLLNQLFSSPESGSLGMKKLEELEINFVLYGPREREIGNPAWIDELRLVSTHGDYAIYENIFP